MSLINQMLRDLEQRRRDRPASDIEETSAEGLRIPAGMHHGVTAQLVRKVVVIPVVLIVAAAGVGLFLGNPMNSASGGSAAAPTVVGMRDVQPGGRAEPPQATSEDGEVAAMGTVALVAWEFIPQREGFRLMLEFSSSPDFSVSRDSARSLSLHLKGVRPATEAISLPGDLPLLAGLQIHELDDGMRVDLSTSKNARFHHILLPESRSYGSRIVLDATFRKPGAERAAPNDEKSRAVESDVSPPEAAPSAPSPNAAPAQGTDASPNRSGTHERSVKDIDRLYRGALQTLEKGDHRAARDILAKIVRLHPGHQAARKTLAVLLYRSGQVSEAHSLFVEGLAMAPGHAPFRKGLARMLAERDENREAVKVLAVDSAPALEDDPDYFSLLAACYQRLGENLQAAAIYRRLVEVRPDSGLWWMGLGIALEDAGRSRPARDAYRRAMGGKGLNEKLMQFVGKRLQWIETAEKTAGRKAPERF